MLDENEHERHFLEASEQQSIEEFIAKLLRAVRSIERKSKAS